MPPPTQTDVVGYIRIRKEEEEEEDIERGCPIYYIFGKWRRNFAILDRVSCECVPLFFFGGKGGVRERVKGHHPLLLLLLVEVFSL